MPCDLQFVHQWKHCAVNKNIYNQREKIKELRQAVMKHKLTGGDSSGKATELQQHLDNEQRGTAVRAVGGSSSSTTAIC